MNVYSKRLDREIELRTEKYGDLELISHQSLVDVFSELNGVDITYDVVSSDMRHSVIFGTITDDKGNRVTELGEALDASLANNIARMYPTTMAFTRAFDRAVVKYLMLPGKNYSNTEILPEDSAPEALQMVVDSSSKTEESFPEGDYSLMPLEQLGALRIVMGKYASCPTTIAQIVNDRSEVSWIDFTIDKFCDKADHPFHNQAIALKTYIDRGGRK